MPTGPTHRADGLHTYRFSFGDVTYSELKAKLDAEEKRALQTDAVEGAKAMLDLFATPADIEVLKANDSVRELVLGSGQMSRGAKGPIEMMLDGAYREIMAADGVGPTTDFSDRLSAQYRRFVELQDAVNVLGAKQGKSGPDALASGHTVALAVVDGNLQVSLNGEQVSSTPVPKGFDLEKARVIAADSIVQRGGETGGKWVPRVYYGPDDVREVKMPEKNPPRRGA